MLWGRLQNRREVDKGERVEITLYDGGGRPVAYIAEDGENSIYLWNGHAVAYIDGDLVYGWNGHHLGFFADGVIYNRNGLRVGSIRERSPYATYAEPAKYARHASYARYAQHAPFAQPAFASHYSEQSFEEFLNGGAIS